MTKTPRLLLTTSTVDASDAYVAYAPPMGLYMLKHAVERRGIECDVADRSLQPELEAELLARIERGHYGIVGFSVSHHNMLGDLETLWRFRAAAARSPKPCLLIGGGQEATLNHEEWLKAGMDAVFLGFAQDALVEFAQAWLDAAAPDAGPVASKVDGVAFRSSGGAVTYRPSPRLDPETFSRYFHDDVRAMHVPFRVYWSRLQQDAATLNFNRNRFVSETVRLYTSSHCPQTCGFCSSQAFLPESQGGRSAVSMLTAEQVFDLVRMHVETYGARCFLFADDDFLVGNRVGIRRALDFCRAISRAKAKGDLPEELMLNSQARVADFFHTDGSGRRALDLELVSALAAAGFHGIGLGVETFSDRLLASPSIHKVGIREADCRVVLDALMAAGLNPTINIILMVPESTVDDLVHSVEVAAEYLLKGCQVSVTTFMNSFPGARVHGRSDYPATFRVLEGPGGERVTYTDVLVPHDPRLAAIMDGVKGAAAEEQERATNRYFDGSGGLPKAISSLTTFLAVAKLLNRRDVAERVSSAIRLLAARNRAASEPARAAAAG
ncbi:MAG: cobalamin B12-binding domain-containing protein [Deltaproteobacteria bacterium]|nr:cobalamin B12-binding domain-containing protein [Deltaproteobacteria bacterium]